MLIHLFDLAKRHQPQLNQRLKAITNTQRQAVAFIEQIMNIILQLLMA